MPVQIRVRDFQSLGDVSLTVDKLTVVTGANNTGKSAIMRALRGAFQNTRGTSFIRHGQPKAIVDIDFGDGHTLTWEKGRGKSDKPTYIVDGGDPIYPGQGVPDEVRALGVHPITAGGREVWPQVAPQFTGQVFLLDQPGSVMAEAVTDVGRVTHLNEALRMAASDKTRASAELATRKGDEAQQQKDVEHFLGLDNVVSKMHEIEESHALATRVEKALEGLIELRNARAGLDDLICSLEGVELIPIPQEAEIEGIRQLQQEIKELFPLRDQLSLMREMVTRLAGVENVPILRDEAFEDVRALQAELQDVLRLRDQRASALSRVTRLVGVEEIPVEVDFTEVEKILAALTAVSDLQGRLREGTAQVLRLEEQLATLEADEASVTTELFDLLGGLGKCPVCGAETHTEEHVS